MSAGELLIYWQVIKRRLWLIGLLVGSTLGVMLLVSFLSPPVYRATSAFQVTSPLPVEVSIFSEFKTSSSIEERARTTNNFVAVLQSEFVVGQVIEELGLDIEFDELTGHMVIEPDENSSFIELHVTSQDAKLAAAISNTLLEKASQYFGGLSAGTITANKVFIQQQIDETKQELDQARANLIQFQIENRVGSMDGLVRPQESLITALKSNRDKELAEANKATAVNYDEIIATRELELQELILLSSEYEVLQQEVNRIEATYGSLLDKETEADLKENEILSARFIQVIPAQEPSRPLPRLSAKVLLLGGILSLVLGIMIAFVLEYSESTTAASGRQMQTSFTGEGNLAVLP